MVYTRLGDDYTEYFIIIPTCLHFIFRDIHTRTRVHVHTYIKSEMNTSTSNPVPTINIDERKCQPRYK